MVLSYVRPRVQTSFSVHLPEHFLYYCSSHMTRQFLGLIPWNRRQPSENLPPKHAIILLAIYFPAYFSLIFHTCFLPPPQQITPLDSIILLRNYYKQYPIHLLSGSTVPLVPLNFTLTHTHLLVKSVWMSYSSGSNTTRSKSI